MSLEATLGRADTAAHPSCGGGAGIRRGRTLGPSRPRSPLSSATDGVARSTWISLVLGHLVVTGTAGAELVGDDQPLTVRVVLALALAGCLGLQVWSSRLEPEAHVSPATLRRRTWVATVVAYVLVVAAPAQPGFETWALLPIPAVALLAASLPTRGQRLAAVAAGVAASFGLRLLASGPDLAFASAQRAALLVTFALVLGVAYLFQIGFWGVTVRLDEARHTEVELAAERQRARFAADLHDIQGHHLEVIALKAELAAKLVSVDVERCTDLIADIETTARHAMEETRAIVADHRTVAFLPQLHNALEVFATAGIGTRVTVDAVAPALPVADDLDVLSQVARACVGLRTDTLETLGFVVREATTNVLRHSQAVTVEVRLRRAVDTVALSIRDRVDAPGERARATPTGGVGAGLDGLRDRVQGHGGVLSTTDHDDGFEVAVELAAPVTSATITTRTGAET